MAVALRPATRSAVKTGAEFAEKSEETASAVSEVSAEAAELAGGV